MSKKSAKMGLTYLVTIIFALVLVGGIGYMILNYYLNSTPDSGLKSINPGETAVTTMGFGDEQYVADLADCRTVLAVFENAKRSDGVCIVLARFMPTANKLVIVPLRPDTCAVVDGKQNTLYEFFRLGGVNSLKSAVESATKIDINKYMVFDQESFTTFSNYMGNISYKVPYNLIYDDPDTGDSIIIREGDQILDSSNLRKVLTCPVYKSGEESRVSVTGTIVCELINSGARGIMKTNLDNVFSTVINSGIETDITKYDYDESRPAMEAVIEVTSSPAQLVLPSGSYNENNCYILDEAFVKALPRWFGLE